MTLEAIMLFITGWAAGLATYWSVEALRRWQGRRASAAAFRGLSDPRTMEERHDMIDWKKERTVATPRQS